jgi:hypothetical protein
MVIELVGWKSPIEEYEAHECFFRSASVAIAANVMWWWVVQSLLDVILISPCNINSRHVQWS